MVREKNIGRSMSDANTRVAWCGIGWGGEREPVTTVNQKVTCHRCMPPSVTPQLLFSSRVLGRFYVLCNQSHRFAWRRPMGGWTTDWAAPDLLPPTSTYYSYHFSSTIQRHLGCQYNTRRWIHRDKSYQKTRRHKGEYNHIELIPVQLANLTRGRQHTRFRQSLTGQYIMSCRCTTTINVYEIYYLKMGGAIKVKYKK